MSDLRSPTQVLEDLSNSSIVTVSVAGEPMKRIFNIPRDLKAVSDLYLHCLHTNHPIRMDLQR